MCPSRAPGKATHTYRSANCRQVMRRQGKSVVQRYDLESGEGRGRLVYQVELVRSGR